MGTHIVVNVTVKLIVIVFVMTVQVVVLAVVASALLSWIIKKELILVITQLSPL